MDAISPQLGKPKAAAVDNGYWSPANVKALEVRGIEPYIATGREPHHQSWESWFAQQPVPLKSEHAAGVGTSIQHRTPGRIYNRTCNHVSCVRSKKGSKPRGVSRDRKPFEQGSLCQQFHGLLLRDCQSDGGIFYRLSDGATINHCPRTNPDDADTRLT